MITYETLEEERKIIKKRIIIVGIIGIAILLITLFFSQDPFTFVFEAIFIVAIGGIFCAGKYSEYKLHFKDFFVKSALAEKFTDLNYNPLKGLDKGTISNTNMMYMGDRFSSNDLITAKYKDIGFTQSDVTIEEERETTDSDGNTHTYYVTIFQGRWMVFEFNKPFRADLQVAQKNFGNNKTGGIFSGLKYNKVKVESEEFNKNFNIYAENEHEAFYILTPQIIEKIMKLDSMNDGRLLLCFVNNKLHVGLYDGKDSFEKCPIFSQIDIEETKNEINKDIEQITMFVDELSLDNDLFRREV